MSEEDSLSEVLPDMKGIDDYSPTSFYSKNVGKETIRGNLDYFDGVQPENETIIYTIDLGIQLFKKQHPTIHTHTIP